MKSHNAQTLPFMNNDTLLYRHSLYEGLSVQLVHITGTVCEKCLKK